ncbi:MAG: TatD family hydrolase [Deltaproteobacteria bacterium]|nr:TatD family hydrolase [Deltaproteobacteria bacterium]
MLIDSHAHLDMNDFEKDREDVLDRAIQGGIVHMVTIGIDLNSSTASVDLARTYAYVSASVGCHPHNADACDPSDLDQLARLASEPEVVAWGEIGLDYFRNYSAREAQLKNFRHQLGLAADLNLPVIIHDREAHEEVYAILKKMGKGERKGVIHCFSGDMALAEAFMDLGYFISIPGTVTYKNAVHIKQVAASIPLSRMLVETDAPFLAPVPRRGKRNEPSYVGFTAKEIARLRKIPFEEVARQTTENAKILFGLAQSSSGGFGE